MAARTGKARIFSSRELFTPALAYRLQERALGGLPPSTRRLLERVAEQAFTRRRGALVTAGPPRSRLHLRKVAAAVRSLGPRAPRPSPVISPVTYLLPLGGNGCAPGS